MKIERLMTLSEFVDLNNYSKHAFTDQLIYRLDNITKYNEFLKQPLTKDMFVGDTAIFNGFEIEYSNYKQTKREIIYLNEHTQLFRKLIFRDGKIEEWSMSMYLYGLATLTNGQLKLKNFNL